MKMRTTQEFLLQYEKDHSKLICTCGICPFDMRNGNSECSTVAASIASSNCHNVQEHLYLKHSWRNKLNWL